MSLPASPASRRALCPAMTKRCSKTLERDLKTMVYGQDLAIATLSSAISWRGQGCGQLINHWEAIFSLARQGWAKPRSPDNWPAFWVWRCFALTCRNIWNAMPFRA